jgi:hypothetical protein
MSWIKATLRFINARRHPDGLVREVETELRFHIEMRTRANVEQGMSPDDARRAAVQSFGNFERVKTDCCEIRRSLPIDSMPLIMAMHIGIATLAGFTALWAVNVPHHSFTGIARQLIPIAVLTYLFIVVRRASSKRRSESEHVSGMFTAPSAPPAKITAYDEHGRSPVERVFKS